MTLVPHLDPNWPVRDVDTGRPHEEARILHRLVEEIGIPSIVLVGAELAGTTVPGGIELVLPDRLQSSWDEMYALLDRPLAGLPTPQSRHELEESA